VRFRAGHPQNLGLYVQMGDEPSPSDQFIGVIFDPAHADHIIETMNPYFTEGE
jgi:hypothetical protein